MNLYTHDEKAVVRLRKEGRKKQRKKERKKI